MNKQKFIEFLKNPDEIKEQNLTELDDLVSENPYFQAARALEAKGNRVLKTRLAGKKTAAAAIYSTNRILLKRYLKGDRYVAQTVRKEKPAHVQAASPPQTDTRIQIKQEISGSAEIVSSPGSSSIDQLIYSLREDMKELEKSRAKYIEVTRKIEEEEAVEKAVKKAQGSTKSSTGTRRSTTSSSSGSSGSARSTAAKKSTSSTKSGTTKKTSSRKTGTTRSATKKTSTKAKSAATKKASATKKATPKKTTAKKTATKSTARKPATRSTTKKSSSRTTRTKTSSSSKSSKKDDNDSEKQRELIDQFIKNNPSFKPGSEPKNVDDLSVDSTSLPEDIGSEYLAEIFLGQGRKEQAIKIYNSLILRFPEKKAYFAGRIKKIK